jgi:hypothetical protein
MPSIKRHTTRDLPHMNELLHELKISVCARGYERVPCLHGFGDEVASSATMLSFADDTSPVE